MNIWELDIWTILWIILSICFTIPMILAFWSILYDITIKPLEERQKIIEENEKIIRGLLYKNK